MGEIKEYHFQADVRGTCTLKVIASSKEEACEEAENGEWEYIEGTVEWDATIPDWSETVDHIIGEYPIDTTQQNNQKLEG